MSNLPNSTIKLIPPTLRGGYCPDSWTEFARTVVGGASAQVNLDRGHTFYNFGNQPVFPTPEPPCAPNECLGGCVEQDMLVDWEPTNIDLNELLQLRYYQDFSGAWVTEPDLTCLSYNQVTNQSLYYIDRHNKVETIKFPNLVNANQIIIRSCSALTTIELPKLESATGNTIKSYWFWNSNWGIYINSVNVTSVVLNNNFVGTNGKIYYFDTNLSQQGIDDLLSIFEAGVAFTSGQLSVFGSTVPSAAGYASKAAIQARGVTVFTA